MFIRTVNTIRRHSEPLMYVFVFKIYHTAQAGLCRLKYIWYLFMYMVNKLNCYPENVKICVAHARPGRAGVQVGLP